MQKLAVLLAVATSIASSGISQDVEATLAAKLDAQVPALLEKYNEPGVALALMDGCSRPVIRVYGLADKQRGAPVREDTVFGLQSISKTFTAWAIMELAGTGRVELDKPVDTYLKRWRVPDSSFDASRVTVRRLLSHTAGISLPSVSSVGPEAAVPTLLSELNAAVKVVKTPGAAYEYSGGGYAILQLLVEDVTGRPFAEYVEQTLLRKLGMRSSAFGLPAGLAARAATPHNAGGQALPRQSFSAIAAAGMYSTAPDMGAFLLAHCQTREPLASMLSPSPVSATAERPTLRFGLGYMLYPARDFTLAGHSGSGAGWSAQFLFVRETGAGIAVLTNSEGGRTRNDILRMFRDAVLQRTQVRE